MTFARWSALLALLLSTLSPYPAQLVPIANAAAGDFVHLTNFSQECPSAINFPIGVGVAFDGKFLWYSCYTTGASPDLFKADPLTGAVVASFTVAGGLGALAWDGNRKRLWAGWGGGAGGIGAVRSIDPATGASSIVFNAAAAAFIDLDDGFAYDAQDDTLYISPDTSTTIYHYSTTGALIGAAPWNGTGCYNSGLGIGGRLLFEGSDGCNHIWVVDKVTKAPAFNFVTGLNGVRDEGLACDSITFSPRTVMWSMEAYSPRRAMAYEIPPGSCVTGGGVDTDGDGLLDEWETNGVTIDPGNGAGPQFVNLPAMGADPNKRDIYLQIDWMQDATHNQMLSKDALQIVVNSFANAPGGGINLHIDEGANSVNFPVALARAHAVAYQANLGTMNGGNYDWSAFQTIKDANFTPTGRTPLFHYVLAAHNYGGSTSSGISRGIGASDLIVSLGSFTNGVGSVQEQAGTLMHELGHNLGLRHGGGDDTNYKPNYLSIMSYANQLGGVILNGQGGDFDYSRFALGSLDENNLSEPVGLGAAAAGYGTRHRCPTGLVAVANAAGAIDWNCDGNSTQTGVQFDINGDGGRTALNSFDDWSHLIFKGGAIGFAGAPPVLPSLTDASTEIVLTPDANQQIQQLRTDTTPPSCVLTSTVQGPPKQFVFTVQDADFNDGLASIQATTAVNATVNVPSFTVGTGQAQTVTATKQDQSQGANIQLTVTDLAGNSATCGVTDVTNGSLALDGASGYAEAANAPDLNITGDWTVETWFKDEDPNGFNHNYVNLLNKGDRQDNSESPYFVTLGYKQLLVGERTGWVDYALNFNLWNAGVDPTRWHHLAVTFQKSTRTITLFLDGKQVATGHLGASTNGGNTLPVEIGRNGPDAGKYFHGKLDDVRIWSQVRAASDIAANYQQQLAGAQSGLVANWHFDDGTGTTAVDSSGNHHDAKLAGGATFSVDIHP